MAQESSRWGKRASCRYDIDGDCPEGSEGGSPHVVDHRLVLALVPFHVSPETHIRVPWAIAA